MLVSRKEIIFEKLRNKFLRIVNRVSRETMCYISISIELIVAYNNYNVKREYK